MLIGELEQARQRRDVAVHAEHGVGRDQLPLRAAARKPLRQLDEVAVAVADELRARQQRGVVEAGVVKPIAENRVAATAQGGDDGEIREIPRREQQRPRIGAGCDPIGQLPLQRLMRREMAGDEMRSTGAHAEPRRTALGCGDQPRIGRESQIVVASELQHVAPIDREARALRRIDGAPPPRKARRPPCGERLGEFVQRRRGQAVVRSPASSAVRPRRLVRFDIGIAGGQELVAVENRIRAREETQRLDRVAELAPTGRESHHRPRHGDPRDRNGAHELEWIDRLGAVERRALDLHQVVDRNRLRIRIEIGELRDQARALRGSLPHADDSAATDFHSGDANPVERFETVAIVAGGDDLAVELGRGVEVVVVIVEARVLQGLGLTVLEKAKRRTGLEPERLDLAHHRQHGLEVAVLRPAPCGAHAEARRARRLGRRGRRDDLGERQKRLVRHAGVVARGLGTVGAILGTATGLDRQQCRKLNGVRRVVRAVRTMRALEEIVKGQR